MARSTRSRGAHPGGGPLKGRGGASKIAKSRQGNKVALHAQTGGIGQFSAHGGKHGTYHGFKSKKQWRWAWATKQPWADEKSHRTKGGPKIRYRRLPESKHSGHKGSRAPS